jgi:hypothetical protein
MTTSRTLPSTDPVASSLTEAIHAGDVDGLRRLLADDPGLAQLRIVDPAGVARSLVHVATDWPGHFPDVAATIAALAGVGADVDAHMPPHAKDPNCMETPLHWAASSDDVAAIDALLDAGADIEATGAIFTGGAPLSDAVVFANWNAARRLVERGAKPTWWQGSALGLLDIVRARWEEEPPPTRDEITRAFWHACRAAQRDTAAFLFERGADVRWIGWDHKTPLRVAEESGDEELVAWLRGLLQSGGRT